MDKTLDNSAVIFFFALTFPGLCELGKQELDLVRSYHKVRGLCDCELCLERLFFILELLQSRRQRLCFDARLDGVHGVLDCLADVLQLELVKEYVAVVLTVLHLQVIAFLRDMLNDLGL